jgi:hypothetical protein
MFLLRNVRTGTGMPPVAVAGAGTGPGARNGPGLIVQGDLVENMDETGHCVKWNIDAGRPLCPAIRHRLLLFRSFAPRCRVVPFMGAELLDIKNDLIY